jgi:ankyrin repeat protein
MGILQSKNSTLIAAATKGDLVEVKRLLKEGAETDGPNAKNSYGWTALILASMNGHKEIVELLLKNGADIEAKDSDGRTALMWASTYGHSAIVELLLKNGADIEAKDSHGWTALIWASARGHKEIVELLAQEWC